MSFDTLVYLGFVGAAFGSLLIALAFFAWAIIGQRGEQRGRRLRMSFAGLLLFLASTIASVWAFYLVILPSTMTIITPEFAPPYAWLTKVLSFVAFASILMSAVLGVRAIWKASALRGHPWLATLGCLVLFVVVSGINYQLIYAVQVPAFERYQLIESKDWRTRVGEAAPDFAVSKLDGTQVRLSDLRGKVVLLNFFATWCGPCRIELPHLEELWMELGDQPDFAMLVVGREETPATVAAFQADNGFSFPMAADPNRSAFNSFADDGIPRTYLISRDGKILFQSIGFGDVPLYHRELAALRRLIEKDLAAVR